MCTFYVVNVQYTVNDKPRLEVSVYESNSIYLSLYLPNI